MVQGGREGKESPSRRESCSAPHLRGEACMGEGTCMGIDITIEKGMQEGMGQTVSSGRVRKAYAKHTATIRKFQVQVRTRF